MSSAVTSETPAKALRRAAKGLPPPPFDQVEPGGPHRDGGLLNERMDSQPVANRATAVAGEGVRDQIEVPLRMGLVERLEQGERASRSAGGRGLRQGLPVADAQRADAQRAIDPDLLRSALNRPAEP